MSFVTRLRDDAGSVTVEFALVAPAVVLLLALMLAGSAAAAEAIRLADAAGVAARALGRGDSAGASAVVARLAPRATMRVERGDFVCVGLDETAPLGLLSDAIPLSTRSCARTEGR